jgi:transposase-like protein
MPRRKFSDLELGERIREGKSVKEVAEEFGVTPRAVYKRAKQLKLNIGKEIVMNQAAVIVKQEINAAEQLLKINETSNQLLDLLIEVVQADGEEQKEKLKKLEPLLGEKASILEALVKIKGEIRQQLRLVMDIWKVKFDTEQIADFQRSVVEEIGAESPALQERILKRLKTNLAAKFGVGWNLG